MKRTLSLSLSIMLMFALLVGCGGNGDQEPATTDKPAESQNTDNGGTTEQPAQEGTALQDGLYYAEGEFAEDSGWKELVAIQVEGGKSV
ncbi:FMN-binding protein, partial [Paenibacillus glucanolyticus]